MVEPSGTVLAGPPPKSMMHGRLKRRRRQDGGWEWEKVEVEGVDGVLRMGSRELRVDLATVWSGNGARGFDVVVAGEVVSFIAETTDEARAWVAALNKTTDDAWVAIEEEPPREEDFSKATQTDGPDDNRVLHERLATLALERAAEVRAHADARRVDSEAIRLLEHDCETLRDRLRTADALADRMRRVAADAAEEAKTARDTATEFETALRDVKEDHRSALKRATTAEDALALAKQREDSLARRLDIALEESSLHERDALRLHREHRSLVAAVKDSDRILYGRRPSHHPAIMHLLDDPGVPSKKSHHHRDPPASRPSSSLRGGSPRPSSSRLRRDSTLVPTSSSPGTSSQHQRPRRGSFPDNSHHHHTAGKSKLVPSSSVAAAVGAAVTRVRSKRRALGSIHNSLTRK